MTGLLGDEKGVALVAVGSYGRRDLAAHSDLDLVLLHRGRRHVDGLAQRLWYPIWDRGVGLDHSVRTVKEAISVADSDLKAALGLLDGRWVAGDASLVDELLDRVRGLWRKRARRWLPLLARSAEERHAQFGEVAFLLEPELKEGRGGLRDVHLVRAAAQATPVVAGLEALDGPAGVLERVRWTLHDRAGKPLDRLLLQEQDGVAAALGYGDADELMADVAAAARAVSYVSDECWRRVASSLAGPRGRIVGSDRRVGPGLVLREGEVVVTGESDVLVASAVAAELGAPLAPATLAHFVAGAPALPDDRWPDASRAAFVRLLGAGAAAVPVLEALDHHGLMGRILPEWSVVRHRPQRNAYHRYTVDRHLFEAAARAATLTRRVARPDLLLVAALLHDIGKGLPGDHSEAGAEVAARVAARMGFPPADVATLERLVRHHLLLADVATRRDLDDPAVVERVAEVVGDAGTLELLAALTEADGLATGPSAWSEWKAGLVADLVARAADHLGGRPRPGGGPELPAPPAPPMPPGSATHLVGEGRRCTVVAPDRPGLFSKVAGVLTLHGLDVLSAQAGPAEGGLAVEVFDVQPAFGGEPSWERVARDLEAALEGRLPLHSRLADRARQYAPRYRPSAARPAEPRVLLDTTSSARATVVEVRAPDGMGVLYRITRALAASGFDVRFARVSTLGHEIVDAFYVVGPDGDKVTDPSTLERLSEAVISELARGWHPR